jgi:hypothetical protein
MINKSSITLSANPDIVPVERKENDAPTTTHLHHGLALVSPVLSHHRLIHRFYSREQNKAIV